MNEANEEKLLPCPFCGGKAEGQEVRTDCETTHRVSCNNCKNGTHVWATPADSSAAWNRRTTPAPQWTTELPTEPGLYYYYQPLYEPDPTVMTIYYDGTGTLTCREMRVSLDVLDMTFPHSLWSKSKICFPALPGKEGQDE